MSIEVTLYSTLTGDAGVQAFVSSGSPLVHRIYAQVAPPNAALPYVSYQLIATSAHNKMASRYDSERKLLQINCISNSYKQAKLLAEAIKAAITVDVGFLMGEGDDYFESSQNHRIRLDFSLIG